MEAAEALKKLADAANKAADALDRNMSKYDVMIADLIKQFRDLGLSLQESMALANMSARYQAQADALAAGRGPVGGGGGINYAPLSTDPYDILIRQLAPELNTTYGLSPQESISLATMSARYQAQADAYAAQQLKVTVDTAQTGDRFAQLIAESIQVATKSGISSGIAGSLP